MQEKALSGGGGGVIGGVLNILALPPTQQSDFKHKCSWVMVRYKCSFSESIKQLQADEVSRMQKLSK